MSTVEARSKPSQPCVRTAKSIGTSTMRTDLGTDPNSTNPQADDTTTTMLIDLPKKKKKHEIKEVSSLKKFLPFVKFGIGIVLMACVCVFMALMWTLIRDTLDKGVDWQLLPEPVHAEFSKFSVSSTSEICNEYARSYYIEGHRLELISTFMMLCLSIAEPHGSGIGGSSIMVFANQTHCIQSTGNSRLPKNLSPFVRELTKTRNAEWTGSYASAIPGDLRTYLFASLLVPEGTRSEIFVMLDKLKSDFEDLHLPVTRRLSDTLKKWNIEANMFSKKQFSNFLTSDGMPVSEGDLFKHNFDTASINKLIVDTNRTEKRDLFNELWREMNSVDRGYYVKNYLDDIENETPLRKGFWSEMVDSNTTICSAFHTDVVSSAPLVPTVLSNLKKSDLGMKFWKNKFINILSTSKFYEWLAGLSDEIWKLAGDIATKKLKKMKNGTKRLLEEVGKMEQTPWDVPAGGNSFVIVDHERNVASVMSATLGTGFGSLVSQMGERKMVILNNLMAGTGRNFSTEADLHHVMEPVIVMKDGKIRAAYAANGGFISRALEVPRKLTSLALTLLADIPLTTSLTTPLFYKDSKDHLAATYDFPSLRYGVLARNKKKDKLPKKHHLQDTVVAVDRNNAIYFNGWKKEHSAVPNGL